MRPGKRGQSGFTYVIVLAALAIFGIGLAAAGTAWSTTARRDKEEEWLAIGAAYQKAIGDYYLQSPGSPRNYPRTLEDLVEDRRFAGTKRHLRKLYGDPLNRNKAWAIVPAPDGGIAGVYSLSEAEPLRRRMGNHYSDWKFVYQTAP